MAEGSAATTPGTGLLLWPPLAAAAGLTRTPEGGWVQTAGPLGVALPMRLRTARGLLP